MLEVTEIERLSFFKVSADFGKRGSWVRSMERDWQARVKCRVWGARPELDLRG